MSEPWRSRIVGHGEEAPDQLLANPRNWRIHPKAQQDALAGVLDQVGWVQDVIVNQRTGHVVDGHARVGLAISREEASVPVVYVDLDEDEEALVLASLDPLAGMAVADQAQLDALLASVSVRDEALRAMLDGLRSDGGHAVSDEQDEENVVAEVERVEAEDYQPFSKRGQVWTLGEHRLMCGDCAVGVEVELLMQGSSADAMWTDPPYGVDYVGKTADALRVKNDSAAGLPALLHAAFTAAPIRPSSPVYTAAPPGPLWAVVYEAFVGAGWRFHQGLVWVKDAMVLGHSDYHFKHENILYGFTPGQGRPGRGKHEGTRWHGDHSQVSVFDVPRPKRSAEHPTMKPIELVERALANSTVSGELLYEPFSGSGTTMIAAEKMGRRCYAMEIEPRYVDVAIRRWEAFTGRKAELVNG